MEVENSTTAFGLVIDVCLRSDPSPELLLSLLSLCDELVQEDCEQGGVDTAVDELVQKIYGEGEFSDAVDDLVQKIYERGKLDTAVLDQCFDRVLEAFRTKVGSSKDYSLALRAANILDCDLYYENYHDDWLDLMEEALGTASSNGCAIEAAKEILGSQDCVEDAEWLKLAEIVLDQAIEDLEERKEAKNPQHEDRDALCIYNLIVEAYGCSDDILSFIRRGCQMYRLLKDSEGRLKVAEDMCDAMEMGIQTLASDEAQTVLNATSSLKMPFGCNARFHELRDRLWELT